LTNLLKKENQQTYLFVHLYVEAVGHFIVLKKKRMSLNWRILERVFKSAVNSFPYLLGKRSKRGSLSTVNNNKVMYEAHKSLSNQAFCWSRQRIRKTKLNPWWNQHGQSLAKCLNAWILI